MKCRDWHEIFVRIIDDLQKKLLIYFENRLFLSVYFKLA